MPLTKCPDCGKEVSPTARACPHCGRPNERRKPRSRTLWVVGALALIILGLWFVSWLEEGEKQRDQDLRMAPYGGTKDSRGR